MTSNPQVKEFIKFLTKQKITDDDKGLETTHTLFGPPWGKYCINEEKIDRFLNLYKKCVGLTNELYVIERQKRIGPLLCDLDFKFDKKYKERQYLDKHIEYVVKKYIEVIKKYVKINNKDLEAFVFEKEKPSEVLDKNNNSKGEYKDGIHIVFPHFAIDAGLRYIITEEVRDNISHEDIITEIPFKNSIDDVFDMSVVMRNGWTMYGSRKQNGQLYKLTHIYDHLIREKKLDTYDNDEIVVLCCVRRFTEEDNAPLKNNSEVMMKRIEGTYRKYHKKEFKDDDKPIASGAGNHENTASNMANEEKMRKVIDKTKRPAGSKGDIETAKDLVKLLSPKRADNYQEWVNVCWALHNVDDCLFDDFIEFSKKCPSKFDYEGCRDAWSKARYDGFTIASLYWWAQKDNPEGYLDFIRRGISKIMNEAESGTHDDIAKVVFELYRHCYKCASINNNIWYEYQGHKWVSVERGYTLSLRISDEVTTEFARLVSSYYMESALKDGIEREHLQKKAQHVAKIIDKLKNVGFRNSVLDSCSHRFFDKEFESKLDEKKTLIGFENGVYDLEEGKFRAGVPDDYISLCVGYDYQDFDEKDPQIVEIMDYFKKVQREEDMRNYILTLISSYIDGRITDQKFIIWTGSGCHKKDTPILMYDGTIKKVQDIKLDEYLMGADNKPRRVKVLFRGKEDMYKIKTEYDDEFIVNKSHRIALRCHHKPIPFKTINIYDEDAYGIYWYQLIEDIPIKFSRCFNTQEEAEEFIKTIDIIPDVVNYMDTIPMKVESYTLLLDDIKRDFKMFRNCVEYENKPTHFAKRTKRSESPAIKEDEISIADLYEYVYNNINVISMKDCFTASPDERLTGLAGLLDKVGLVENDHYVIPKNIVDEHENIMHFIKTLGFSMKLKDDKYILEGKNVNKIRTKILKRVFSVLNDTDMYFNVEFLKNDNFYGFEVDGDHKYIMADGIVTYNSNGKSTTVELMKYTFGQYFGVLPVTILTRRRGSSSSATPELADKRGRRCLVIQEPEHDDVIFVGYMKELTGGDTIQARALYGAPFEYKPQFKLLLTCNKLPSIPANDGGTWRRLRVTPFEAKFVDPKVKIEDPTIQFIKDPTLIERMLEWKSGFMWLLLNKYYPKYKDGGLIEPKKVTQYTDKYKQDSDIIYEFLAEMFIITKDEKDKEALQQMYNFFKSWYREAHTASGVAPRKDFQNYLVNSGFKVENGVVFGIKSKNLDED